MKLEYLKLKFANLRIKVREFFNPYLGAVRLKRGKVNPNFTIISNNCWAGHVYRYFNVPYQTPTIGLFIFSEDYVKFCKQLKDYLSSELKFISIEESKYKDILKERKNDNVPIGVLKDIEIVFLHYHSEDEAREKWNRRKSRMNWNNLYFKMSEQNLCSFDCLMEFDSLPTEQKVVFVSKDYNLKSQIIFKEWEGKGEILNDTTNFRKYINLEEFLKQKKLL